MGRWLDRIKKTENTQSKHCQNRQKPENTPFGSFGSASNGDIQEKNSPSIWDVRVKNGGDVVGMTVIDPKRDSDEVFIRGLHDRFGVGRVINAKRRKHSMMQNIKGVT